MANITVSSTLSNIAVDSTTDIVTVSQTASNVIVGTTVTESVDERVVPLGTVGGNISLDLFQGRIFTATLNADVTGLNISNVFTGRSATIIFTQNAFGGHDLNTSNPIWNDYEFVNNYKNLDTDPLAFSIMNILYDGSIYYASIGVEEALVFPNSQLANSNIIINGTTIDLGSSANISPDFSGSTTDDLPQGTNNIYFSTSGATVNTDNLTEGSTNKYYSDTLSRDAVSVTQASASGSGTLAYSNVSGVFTYTPPDLTAFGLTNAQAQAYIETNGLNGTGNLTMTGTTAFGSSADQTHTITGNLDVTGNIEVSGNLNYRNVEDLYVRDQSITLNANAASDATVSIIANRPVAGANTVLRWNETTDKWQFSNDGSTYQDLIGLTNLSVTTAAASGNGALSYNNTTGVFNFTPANTTATGNVTFNSVTVELGASGTIDTFLTNVDMQANATVNGNLAVNSELLMGGNVVTNQVKNANDLTLSSASGNIDITTPTTKYTNITAGHLKTSSTSNIEINSDTAVDNLYGLKFDKGTNKFISSPDSATKAPDHFITIEKEGTDFEAIRGRIARSGSFGWEEKYEKAEGTLASPTALGNDDELWRVDYLGHDGTGYGGSGSRPSMTMRVFQDDETASVSTGIVPLTYEIAGQLDGDLSPFPTSFMSIHSDGKIVFNDAGTRSFNSKTGTANISRDGSIVSAADITSRATLVGANLTVAGLSYPSADGTTGQVLTTNGAGVLTFTSAAGTYGNIDVANFLANGFGSNTITTTGDITTSGFFEGDLNGAVTIDVYNDTVSTLTKGSTVYLTGGNTGDNPHVELADNTDSAKMPAIGVVRENIGASSVGQVVTSGEMNYTSHGYTLGADLFVNNGGGLTTVVPSGESELIQKIGKVISTNHIMVQGAFRTNATPNLDSGNIFLGNASGKAVTATFTTEANAAILDYSGDITRMNQANISRISVGGGDIDLDSGLLTFPDLQFYTETSGERYFIGAQMSASTSTGITDAYVKSRGSLASPSVLSNNDRLLEIDYYGHDGTNFIQTMGEHIYHDNATSGISTGTLPMAKELYTKQDGVTGGFDMSIVKFRADRTIAFNDTGTRGFGSGAGNANIQMDGTINTVSGINATGNISAGNVSTTIITATGDISAPTMTPEDITLKSFQETVVDLGTTNGDISSSVDANQGSIFTMVANGAVTFNSIANVSAGSSFVVKIKQDVTGSHALTSSMLFLGGNSTLSTGANDIDVISVLYDGTDYLASLSHDYK